jgi:hypothetical protein
VIVLGADREPPVSTLDDVRRMTAESRARLAGVRALREQHQLITSHSRQSVEASRLLLGRRPARV